MRMTPLDQKIESLKDNLKAKAEFGNMFCCPEKSGWMIEKLENLNIFGELKKCIIGDKNQIKYNYYVLIPIEGTVSFSTFITGHELNRDFYLFHALDVRDKDSSFDADSLVWDVGLYTGPIPRPAPQNLAEAYVVGKQKQLIINNRLLYALNKVSLVLDLQAIITEIHNETRVKR